MTGPTFPLAAVLVVVAAAAAARPSLQADAPAPQVPGREAILDASVVDRAGAFIHGLSSSDFRVVTSDGKQIPITLAREVTIPPGSHDKVLPAPAMPLQFSNRHARDARLFVIVYEPMADPASHRHARQFLNELVAARSADDHIAVFVAGRQDLDLPPTADAEVLGRAFDRLTEARLTLEPTGLTRFVLEELPRVYESFMATRWTQRSIVFLTPGYIHPAGLQNHRSWEAWWLRANAPMHAVDPMGAVTVHTPAFGPGDHPLLRQAAQQTQGLAFINHSSMDGIAAKVLAASSRFYQVVIDLPEGVASNQSLFMTVRTHPTATVRSRRRVRMPIPDPSGARAGEELRKALEAPLPMDEIPIEFAIGAPAGATSATIRFRGAADRQPTTGVVELPPLPMTLAIASVSDRGRLQVLSTRQITASDLQIDGCCATTRQDVTIPAGTIGVRAAIYYAPTGQTGSVYLNVADRRPR